DRQSWNPRQPRAGAIACRGARASLGSSERYGAAGPPGTAIIALAAPGRAWYFRETFASEYDRHIITLASGQRSRATAVFAGGHRVGARRGEPVRPTGRDPRARDADADAQAGRAERRVRAGRWPGHRHR